MPKISRDKIERIMKKVAQELPGDYSAQLMAARKLISKLVDRDETKQLTTEDKKALVEFLGPESTIKLLMVEEAPAITRSRATTVVNWLDILYRALQSKASKKRIMYLARKTALELINALADTTVRS